jgi:hypothetical protein
MPDEADKPSCQFTEIFVEGQQHSGFSLGPGSLFVEPQSMRPPENRLPGTDRK